MPSSIISRIVNSNCHTRSLSIRHLTKKLDRLNDLTSHDNAQESDYIQRDRVEKQLIEASAYLC